MLSLCGLRRTTCTKKVAIALGVIAFGGMVIFGGAQALVTFIIIAVIVAGFASLMSNPTPMTIMKKKCVKQPHLDCPLTVELTSRGGMKADGHFKCCQIMSQMKAMNRAFCNMEPGVNYNGISINESVKQSALRQKEHYDKLDDSGPAGYKKNENESIPKHND